MISIMIEIYIMYDTLIGIIMDWKIGTGFEKIDALYKQISL